MLVTRGLLISFPEPMAIAQHLKVKLFFSFGSELNIIETLIRAVWTDIQGGGRFMRLSDWGEICLHFNQEPE